MVEIKSSFGPLSEAELNKHEQKWGTTLPTDYRQFLMQFNGGEVEPRSFSSAEEKPISSIRSFLGINGDKHTDLFRYIKTYKGRLPARFLPIAFDSFGNLICISLHDPDRGSVFFWDHELEADPDQGENPETIDNITRLAGTFTEFLAGLHEFKRPDNFDQILKNAKIIK